MSVRFIPGRGLPSVLVLLIAGSAGCGIVLDRGTSLEAIWSDDDQAFLVVKDHWVMECDVVIDCEASPRVVKSVAFLVEPGAEPVRLGRSIEGGLLSAFYMRTAGYALVADAHLLRRHAMDGSVQWSVEDPEPHNFLPSPDGELIAAWSPLWMPCRGSEGCDDSIEVILLDAGTGRALSEPVVMTYPATSGLLRGTFWSPGGELVRAEVGGQARYLDPCTGAIRSGEPPTCLAAPTTSGGRSSDGPIAIAEEVDGTFQISLRPAGADAPLREVCFSGS